MKKKIYSVAEILEIIGKSRQTLNHARNGYISRGYEIKPRLERGKDWDWKDGKVIYFESSLEILKQTKKGRKRKND